MGSLFLIYFRIFKQKNWNLITNNCEKCPSIILSAGIQTHDFRTWASSQNQWTRAEVKLIFKEKWILFYIRAVLPDWAIFERSRCRSCPKYWWLLGYFKNAILNKLYWPLPVSNFGKDLATFYSHIWSHYIRV